MSDKGRDYKNIVKIMYLIGEPLEAIAKAKDSTVEEITMIIHEFGLMLYKTRRSSEILGSKKEPYSTEEEMINPPTYSYDDLSTLEKRFYESRTDM